MSIDLEELMQPDEICRIGIQEMTEEQQQALASWGMRMFSLGQHIVGNIENVKYNGRLIILDDDTRWEVDELDASTAEMWDTMDRVVIIDNEMFKLDDLEKVSVQQDED